jgi:hypothetical protein
MKAFLATVSENQLIYLMAVANAVSEEAGRLLAAAIDWRSVERRVTPTFIENNPQFFTWRSRDTNADPYEVKIRELDSMEESQLREQLKEIVAKAKDTLNMHSDDCFGKLALEVQAIRSKYVKNGGLCRLAADIKRIIDKEEKPIEDKPADNHRIELVDTIGDIDWAAKVLTHTVLNIQERSEITSLIDVKAQLAGIIAMAERVTEIINEVVKANHKEYHGDEAEELPEESLESLLETEDLGCRGCFSGIDVKNLIKAVAAVEAPEETPCVGLNGNPLPMTMGSRDCIGTGVQLPGNPIGHTDEVFKAAVAALEEPASNPLQEECIKTQASAEQDAQRAFLRDQLNLVKKLSTKEIINTIRGSHNGTNKYLTEEYLDFLLTELKNRT